MAISKENKLFFGAWVIALLATLWFGMGAFEQNAKKHMNTLQNDAKEQRNSMRQWSKTRESILQDQIVVLQEEISSQQIYRDQDQTFMAKPVLPADEQPEPTP